MANMRMCPKYNSRQVFNTEQESELKDYLLTCSAMCYGLSLMNCRELAFEIASRNGIDCPETWKIQKKAGIEWVRGFLKRHPDLSLRQPEACSLSRATSFNKHNVGLFFDKLETVLKRSDHFSNGLRIFNFDETGCSTGQKPTKIIAGKGVKQVAKVTSGEKGSLVTSCYIVNAAGNTLPPVIIFPRMHFKEHMLHVAPTGSLGLATQSGWMNGELFVEVLHHFVKHSFSSLENPAVLILDIHESHLSIEAIELAKENGVTILTIPPHCSNRLQPLDVSVFAAFKSFYNASVDSWMMRNPGKTVSIYDVASLICEAHEKAMTPANITPGFRKTGIFPFNRNVFSEQDFLASAVTDREISPTPEATRPCSSKDIPIHNSMVTTGDGHSEENSLTPSYISPVNIHNYPKAGKRLESANKRKKGRSFIPTDTPEKNQLALQYQHKMNSKRGLFKKCDPIKIKFTEISNEDEEFSESDVSSDNEVIQLQSYDQLARKPKEVDFVLVEFSGKNTKFYIGEVLREIDIEDYEVKFLRKSEKMWRKFFYPYVPDIASVATKDIRALLPVPSEHGKTKRQKSYLKFCVDFGRLNVL
ncbi:tigger transposable element-derived protein 6-like [Bacillus rossius redtenbacheri]|uniref:tigger transposable element-derived protein 6-like n=1 Tax=Bacillus rossius redtenbacheri TaxID=93214 RepID=UPI002FDE8FCB